MSWKAVRLITQIKKLLLITCLISTKTLQKPDISTLDNYAFRKEIFYKCTLLNVTLCPIFLNQDVSAVTQINLRIYDHTVSILQSAHKI